MKTYLFDRWKREYWPLAVFVVLFAVVGVILLLRSHAATPYASIEAESGSSSLSPIADSKASNGSYIQFGSKSTTTTNGPLGPSKAMCTSGGANYTGSNGAS